MQMILHYIIDQSTDGTTSHPVSCYQCNGSVDHKIQLDKHVHWSGDKGQSSGLCPESVPAKKWRETIKLVLDNFKR